MDERTEPTREEMIEEIIKALEDATYIALHAALSMLRKRK